MLMDVSDHADPCSFAARQDSSLPLNTREQEEESWHNEQEDQDGLPFLLQFIKISYTKIQYLMLFIKIANTQKYYLNVHCLSLF